MIPDKTNKTSLLSFDKTCLCLIVADGHNIPARPPHQLHCDLVHVLHAADLLDDEVVRQEDHTTYHTTRGEKKQEKVIFK